MSHSIRLAVPFFSQMDSQWGFAASGSERSMCGVMCLKAVLDYYESKDVGVRALEVAEIVERVRRANTWRPEGISHATQVHLLKRQGLLAWRRNWHAPTTDPEWLAEHEGYGQAQVAAVAAQQAAESDYDAAAKELHSIQSSLAAGNPVIASVKAAYGNNRVDHQIVLAGWDEGRSQLWVMDPERAPGSELQTDSIEHFMEFFNHRAIFMQP